MTLPDVDAARPGWRRGVGAVLVLILGALVVVVGAAVLRSAAGTSAVPLPSLTGTIAAAPLYVHVAGAVREPGLYRLVAGARVVDAIGAAGGMTEEADPAAVNLARPLADGEQLQVPRIGDATIMGGPTSAADGLIDLNAADAATLDTLPGIGPALAGRIIDWREENGRFTAVDDLLAVSGIGDKLVANLRDLVRV